MNKKRSSQEHKLAKLEKSDIMLVLVVKGKRQPDGRIEGTTTRTISCRNINEKLKVIQELSKTLDIMTEKII